MDLARVSAAGARVFAGYRWGKQARYKTGLARYDKDPEMVVMVRLPMDTITLDASFVRGMFGASIRRFQKAFSEKYQLIGGEEQLAYFQPSFERDVQDLLPPPAENPRRNFSAEGMARA